MSILLKKVFQRDIFQTFTYLSKIFHSKFILHFGQSVINVLFI